MKPLEISINLKNKGFRDFMRSDIFHEYIDNLARIPKYLPIKGFLELRKNEIKTREDFESFLDVFINVLSKGKNSYSEYLNEIKWFLGSKSSIKMEDLTSSNKPNLMRIYDFLDNLSSNTREDDLEFNFVIKYNKSKLITQEYSIKQNKKIVIKFTNEDKISFISDFISLSTEENEDLAKIVDTSNTIFNTFVKKHELKSTIPSIFQKILSYSLGIVKSEFTENKINYVSPLRAHPKRYYMLDKAKVNYTLDTLDGDAIADVLKENSTLKAKVNNWLTNFNLSVNVEEFKEVVHHLKVKQNNLNLDITDVGFGISQVLPVIIQGFLSGPDSTTIIEQPEIHLHPKMQAEMADLFIDIILNSKGKKLIIETHSEYLLKRLRRRISEGKIDSEDVAICLFYPQTDKRGGNIEVLKIQDKGFFEWPEDFYGGDLYDDTVEFLKNQN